MGHADDCIAKLETLRSERIMFEGPWRDCISLALPFHVDFTPGGVDQAANRIATMPQSELNGRRLYDSAGITGVDRLASGMESLVTPQSEKWHGLKSSDAFAVAQSDEENEYFEGYRDYLFVARYDAGSGFVNAHQRALRSTVALGSGIVFVEENFGGNGVDPRRRPFMYSHRPLTRCYMAQGKDGNNDTMYYVEPMTARQMCQRFGHDGVSEKVKEAANDPKKQETRFQVLHAIYPRTDRFRGGKYGIANGAFESCYIETEGRHLIRDRVGGFYEWPFMVYHWQQGDAAYGESALMFALAELKALQVMGKTGLRMHQQMADPPLAVAHDGVKVRLNLNPRAVNYGMVNPDNGQLLAKPIHTGQLPQVFNEYVEGKRKIVADALYISLFQILVQNPQMTATEAMLRANEKGELLGPAGSKIQSALAAGVDREIAILARKGIYEPGSPLEPPRSLGGRSFGVQFTGPLDRLRRAQELVGINQTAAAITPWAQMRPDILDNFDTDEIARISTEVTGAPQRILMRREEMQQMRQERAAAAEEANAAVQQKAEADAAIATAEGMDAMAGVGQRLGPAIAAMEGEGAPA